MDRDAVTLAMQVLVSLVLLIAGIYFLAGSGDESLQKWAAGWVGAVAGYWLR